MWIYVYAFCRVSEKYCKYAFLGGSTQIITILHRGVIEIYYITTKGGGVFPIYYNITRGRWGSLGTPNLYYVIYERPLKIKVLSEESFSGNYGLGFELKMKGELVSQTIISSLHILVDLVNILNILHV